MDFLNSVSKTDHRRVMVVRKPAVLSTVTSNGCILLNSSMKPLFVNPAAAQILVYPQNVEAVKNLDQYLASKISSILLPALSSHDLTFVPQFQSGGRSYLCRAFRVNVLTPGDSKPSVAIILERCSDRRSSLDQVSGTFHLTTREREVFQQLVEDGLTTKDIAVRMGISPNTVKAFLHLIMVKMGVTTRSGIVAKALSVQQSQ